MKAAILVATAFGLTCCGQRSSSAEECPSHGPNKVAEGPYGPYQYRDDCEANALTCIDPLKLVKTGNGVVMCKVR